MSSDLYSVDQVAERLGLHVRTVRGYVRDGRLKAVRIGKQYRIAEADLEAFTGQPAPPSARESARRTRHVEASSIVQIDAISAADASRLTTVVLASLNGAPTGLRVESLYDEERARLKLIVLGDVAASADLLRLIDSIVGGLS